MVFHGLEKLLQPRSVQHQGTSITHNPSAPPSQSKEKSVLTIAGERRESSFLGWDSHSGAWHPWEWL